ncbi:alpha/beta fold hydrolase [Streptomyces sp. JJ36]|uniref:alpha/beta fold hydrolase n=1 Tax=Streptomyces sp. JJ36 TaxID=2736645 RepID=UPI001F307352|nr:alpha/beta fold hydrolase [Streptomyces sp. JJ36]MCF6526536.1 alpha/beta fold hydrolase [Streptomyces sp. JJ36]
MSRPPILELPAGARAYRLATRRGEFAVHDTGAGERGTALLVPGFTGSKEDFLGLLEPLARRGFRVVAVDGRGQYETGGPRDETAYAQHELAADVLAQAGALDCGPPHLLGHSLGGLVARAAALHTPAAFASLTLMSSGPGPVSTAQQGRLKMLLGALPVMDMDSIWQAMRELDPPEAADEATPPEVADFLHRRWLANVPEQLVATGRQLIAEPDRTAELATLPLPLHVLSGERDYAWPPALMDDLARRTGARRTVIAGAEHSPNAEQPEETAEALAAAWSAAAPDPHEAPARP